MGKNPLVFNEYSNVDNHVRAYTHEELYKYL